MPKTKTIQTHWYDQPHYYDLAFRSETRREADFIEAACRKYVKGKARRLLEPACGTGRLVAEMATRGYDVAGFDLNRPSLDYLRQRLARRKLRANVFEADMTEFRLSQAVDAAFCTFNTFRLLLDEKSARGHLESVADALRPGGIYILGLHLLPLDADEESTERWTEQSGQTRVTTTLRVLDTDRRRRIERLRVSMLVRDRGRELRFRDEFAFRMYTAAQFRRLLASVPSFELCDVYDFWYEIDSPMKLNNDREDSVFILRKRA
jgi:SAM-dependent methyltransferase